MTEARSTDTPYPSVPTRADFPAMERRILDQWERQRTFERSVEQRPADDEYVFYDGPPFANGLPHYGHLLTGYVKDVVPRYQTMRGHRVERRFGWDCHGLPAEMQTEKELGVSGHVAINEYGIDRFNEECRASVMRFTGEWERYVTRQARWVDFENDYKTMDATYMESVIWAFKQLWDKGLIYEAYRVMPYSWGAETPLSNFEIRLDDATRPRQDPALTVAFTLRASSGEAADLPDALVGADGTEIWAWTTTPWTLPSNLALAVGPDVDYVVVQLDEDPRRASCGHRRQRRVEVRRRAGRGTERRGTPQGLAARRSALRAAAPLLRRPRRQLPRARRRLRHRRRRHRRGPHRPRLRRGRPACLRGQRHRVGVPGRRRRTFHRRGHRLRRPERLRREPGDHQRPQGRWRGGAPRHLRPQLPALLADRHADHLQGRVVLVRRGHRDPRPARRAQPGDQLDPLPRARRPVRQVARRCPRLVHLAQPLLGLPHPRVAQRRPRVPADRRLRLARRDRARTSACDRPTCTARTSTT